MQLIVFILILSVLILIHELGHFLMARLFKMRVEEFGVGLPPRAKTLFVRKGTTFSLNWLPLGGFVKLYGEDMSDPAQASSPDAFFNKPMWQRACVFVAGVFMNFVLGVIVFAIVYSHLGIPTKTNKVIIIDVSKDSPAQMAGIQPESEVKSISFGKEQIAYSNVDEFVKKVDSFKGKELDMNLLQKDGVEKSVKITPRVNPPEGQGGLGVALSNIVMMKFPFWQMPFRGVVIGLQEAIGWGKEIFGNLVMVITDIFTGKGLPKDIAGPVGIYQVSKEVYKVGWIAILQFMGILSINLAILNVMPFPALDGGHIIFLGIEKIIGKKLKNKIEGYVHMGGMVILLALMVLITVKDVLKLFVR